ncbi:hypothetical protein J437_LFUL005495, partial [Ladona fulva]
MKIRTGVMDSSRGKKKTRNAMSSFRGKSPNDTREVEEDEKTFSTDNSDKQDVSVSSSIIERPQLGEDLSLESSDIGDETLVSERASTPVKSDSLKVEHSLKSAEATVIENGVSKHCLKDKEWTAVADKSSLGQSAESYSGMDSTVQCVVIVVEPDSHSDDGTGKEKDYSQEDGDKEDKSELQEASFTTDEQQNSSVENSEPMDSTLNESHSLLSSTVGNLESSVDKINISEVEEAEDSPNYSLHEGEEYINPHGVRFTPYEEGKDDVVPHVPHNIVCVQELFLFLVSLCNPNEKQNTEDNIRVSLKLLIVSLEVGADAVGSYNSLLTLVKGDLCRNIISLLSSERLTNFAADLQLAFLLFESLRSHLKFQMEAYLVRLASLTTNTDSTKIQHEKREVALESLLQFWRIPGFVTELYVNYDCDPYCSNVFEDLTDLLSKNAYPVSGVQNTHLLSLSALLSVVDSIEYNCRCRVESESKPMGFNGDGKRPILGAFHVKGRKFVCENVPTHEEIMAIKHRKELLSSGTEHFNSKPSLGIQVLQENGQLSSPLDPQEVARFFRENPMLDKNKIGEYISNKKNLKVLECFVKSFDFAELRIDEALRLYLETFRLPGEAIPISLVLEQFADHWHSCNGKPFANSDAAFTLAYAVIMLNVDQHNYNAKKQSIPMTAEDFMKNLKGVNGGKDFEKEMLESIYNAIKKEEIVMPAEQTGIVRENYLWKVLLRRGASKEGTFIHTPVGLFDHELFTLIRRPTVAALCLVFDRSDYPMIYELAISGFKKCAMISAHYSMSNDFDSLVISLCKFTTLLSSSESMDMLAASFGESLKAQLAAKSVFGLAHRHGDILRDGWKNVLDCIIQLFKCKLLPKELVE